MRIAIWAAVSTAAQAKGWDTAEENIDDKESLSEQIRKCRAVAAARGWEDTGLQYVAPGYSRTLYVNLRDAEEQIPALHQLLEDAKVGRYDLLVMYDYNRLRDLLDPVAKSLVNYGVQLYSCNQPVEPLPPEDYGPYSSDSDSMMRGMNQIISRWQIADMRRKYRFGIRARVEKGLPALKIPYGYMKPPGREQDKKVAPIPHPVHSKVVIEIKDLFLSGKSIEAICDHLTERYPTPTGIPQWSKQSVRKILRNPFHAGKIAFPQRITVHDSRDGITRSVPNPNPEITEGAHTPLYSYETYQKIMTESERRASIPTQIRFPWSGLLWCAECGYRMRRHSSYYACKGCGASAVTDKELAKGLPSALQNALRKVEPVPPDLPMPSIAEAQAELEAKRKKIQQGYESDNPIYTLQEAEAGMKEIARKIKALHDGRLQAMKRKAEREQFVITMEEAQKILDDFPQWMMSDDVKIVNEFLLRLFKKVGVRKNKEFVPELYG